MLKNASAPPHVPISFVGRTIEEGKKIRAIDALYTTQRLWQSRTARSS